MVDLKAASKGRRFEGRTVLVTGVGGGSGLATVLRFGLEGANVVAVARSEENLARAKEVLGGEGVPLQVVRADVSTGTGAEAAIAQAVETHGKLDVLVCTAGGFIPGGIKDAEEGHLEEMLDTNLRTVFYAAKAATPELEKQEGASMVFTTAVFGGQVPGPGLLAYNASKGAATALCQSLAGDLVEHGIRVNAILPGGISHDFDASLDPSSGRIIGKGPATPQDIAAAAVFLASEEACWITGACLVVDGGFSVSRKAF